MPTFTATLTETNPAYTEGHGGGRRTFDLEEVLSGYDAGGGGRRVFTLTEGFGGLPGGGEGPGSGTEMDPVWTPPSVGGFNPALWELLL